MGLVFYIKLILLLQLLKQRFPVQTIPAFVFANINFLLIPLQA